MSALEARGLFWWADEVIPDGYFAPESCVSGFLKIDNEGRIALELDGYLPSEHGPMSALLQRPVAGGRKIRGLLKGSGEHVLLLGLVSDGGQMTTQGISFERYSASGCLVCETNPVPQSLRFRRLIIPLSGYEEWLGLGTIKVSRTSRMVSATYKRQKKNRYDLASGSLTIDFDLRSQLSGARGGSDLTMTETGTARFSFAQAQDIDQIKKQYLLFEDLLNLLTATDYALDWPFAVFGKNHRARFYFGKHFDRQLATPPRFSECVANFPALCKTFGAVWETWQAKREELGPGVYLYLGTRRRIPLYIENRFINLVSGIEGLHRRRPPPSTPTALQEKIKRILGEITDAGDKKWLARQLRFAHEPSLGDRIFETLSKLPLGLEHKRLRTFARACNQLRNDISHYGGLRPEPHSKGSVTYDEFLRRVSNASEALSILYQMLLLYEIGVSAERLKWWVSQGFYSFTIKTVFARVGLIDESEVKTPVAAA